MKKIFLILFISITSFGFSQKLKVKKNTILLDGNEIAKMDVDGETYLFQDLEDKTLAKIDFSGRETNSLTELWVNVSNPEGTASNEVSFRPGLTINPKKMLAGFIQKELKFFDKTGIKNDVITSFFASKIEREDKKDFDALFAKEKEASEWLKKNYIVYSSEGVVKNSKTNFTVFFMTFKNPQGISSKNYSVIISDLNQDIIATIVPIKDKVRSIGGVSLKTNSPVRNLKIKGYDKKVSDIFLEGINPENRQEFYELILKNMYWSGYAEVLEIGVEAAKEKK